MDKAIAMNERYYLGWFNKGYILLNMGKKDEAIMEFNKARQLKPEVGADVDALIKEHKGH